MERPVSPEPQWEPTAADIADAQVTAFARSAGHEGDYHDLWQWSVDEPEAFWGALWRYFDLGEIPGEVLADDSMPGAVWFPGVRLNYVDQIARQARTDRPAILSLGEDFAVTELSWAELLSRTAAFANTLAELGVRPGDRVVGYLPNIAEAVVAFLGTASIGAVWSACGQDYSAKAALDRLGQLEPVVLVTADGYRFGGKTHDKSADVAELRAGLPSLTATISVSRLAPTPEGQLDFATVTAGDAELRTTEVEFDHPLWILFSSGTTGLPKGIVHGHGGVLVEHLKAVALQSDIGPTDTFFWYTSPSWMMWNFQVAGLLVGATIVCYDGSPSHPTPDALWEMTARLGVTVLGTSPGYVLSCAKAGAVPRADHDLRALRTVGITGSSLPASTALWMRDNLGAHVQVASISGGTDVVSAFIGGVRTVPVWPGELSVPFLGAALDAWDELGTPVRGEVGELVITKPLPSMPVSFWNDPDGSRYWDAYFDMFPGVWRHGDWITITERGSVIVHGRSDSTLNRHGIRMGSADIYQSVERLPEIAEALVIGAEQPDGGYWMPLFVVPADGVSLTDELVDKIKQTIRTEVSPRHVPDEVILAPGIPHTRTGKKLEVPIKKLFQGADVSKVVERSAVDNPDLLDWYAAQRR
ncbi:acetoacetate--CoA ligase [Mycolicibacterium neoaurum]|uniref:Acetoacetyl-CoA synthetase n=1 Tax=Mycolicibacterium neoaurum VKM Ac-1815D TaxID=700508 RepID=V5XHT8_MYCNE|nr:acetoacetyl-CoA synthetase [Mycolicibacterium neoaurum VKM Ac-1815D]AMO07739.1 acetoacetyl-CoA synthetase [Mycolicibacterium neoaurum]KJQ49573.1 acetoacetyl-CoA synthetase [Mycolicibacterium neoaurum]KUM06254.1 acetoacetyl-CoA synthetase [Mycolicibacterium neoaurum]